VSARCERQEKEQRETEIQAQTHKERERDREENRGEEMRRRDGETTLTSTVAALASLRSRTDCQSEVTSCLGLEDRR
jgi:hypothetical protein